MHKNIYLIAKKNMQTQMQETRPAVNTIWADSITRRKRQHHCTEISGFLIGLLICLTCNVQTEDAVLHSLPLTPSPIFSRNNPTQSLLQRAQSGFLVLLRNQFPFQISRKEPVWCREFVLALWYNLEPSQASQLEKFTTCFPSFWARKVGLSEAFPDLDFCWAQATKSRSWDNQDWENEERPSELEKKKFTVLSLPRSGILE